MTTRKSILIICHSDLSREPRVIRQILAFKKDYHVFTMGYKPSMFTDVTHYTLQSVAVTNNHLKYPWLIRKIYSAFIRGYHYLKIFYKNIYFEKLYWTEERKQILENFKSKYFDIIIAHHPEALPLAVSLAKNKSRLIFNAHDYYTAEFENNINWVKSEKKFIAYLMNKYLPKFELIFAAWNKLTEDFGEKYSVPAVTINNATEYYDLLPSLKKETDPVIKIIHHGIANKDREIEKMIEMMSYLDDHFRLDFMLITSPHENDYFQKLKKIASSDYRIKFIDPVPTRDIPGKLNDYDIGLFLLPINGINSRFTLPNKIFEFVQARISVLVTPNPEMKKLVDEYDLGWVANNFEPAFVSIKIKNISYDEINQKKLNVHAHAFELSAEKNYIKMKNAFKSLLQEKTESEKIEHLAPGFN